MLKALMEYVGEKSRENNREVWKPQMLTKFFLVRCTIFEIPIDKTKKTSNTPVVLEEKQEYYLCLGKHNFFFVPRIKTTDINEKVPPEKKKILVSSYTEIGKLYKDRKGTEGLEIAFIRGTLKRYHCWSNGQESELKAIRLYCSERDLVKTEILVSLQTSAMYLTFEIFVLDLEAEKDFEEDKSEKTLLELADAEQFVKELYQTSAPVKGNFLGYFFLYPDEYKESVKSGTSKKQFEKPFTSKNSSLDLGQKINQRLACASLTIQQIEPSGERSVSIQSICERQVHEICNYVADWKLREKPCTYQKKHNIVGDRASWTCWMMKIRTLKGHPDKEDTETRPYQFRQITVLAARRNFIPPTMQSSCDFVITHISQYQDFVSDDKDNFAQMVYDTLTPESRRFDIDDIVVQATADALLLDSPSFSWYETQLKVVPVCHSIAIEICDSIFHCLRDQTSIWTKTQKEDYTKMIEDWKQQYWSTSKNKAYREEAEEKQGNQIDEPSLSNFHLNIGAIFEKTDRLENEKFLKFPPTTNEIEMKRNKIAWKVRVWRYLAHCIDGGVYKEALDFDQITKAWKHPNTTDPEVRRVLTNILLRCLHLRKNGEEFKSGELKITDTCTFNERVMMKLLRTGYISAALSAHSNKAYPEFLVRLLHNDGSYRENSAQNENLMIDAYEPSEKLSHCVLKCLVFQSSAAASTLPPPRVVMDSSRGRSSSGSISKQQQAPQTNEMNESGEKSVQDVADILVPALIQVFMRNSSDDKLQTMVIATLCNFSRNNHPVKARIMAAGFGQKIVKCLKTKYDDLVLHSCNLLTNLTKTPDFREAISKSGIDEILLNLLSKNSIASSTPMLPDEDKYRHAKIISQACLVLGNLAIDESIRDSLLKKVESKNDSDGLFKIPTFIRSLADLILVNGEYYVLCEKKKSSKERQEWIDVRSSVLFALKNLCLPTSDQRSMGTAKIRPRSALGRYASKDLVRMLKDKEVTDGTLLDHLLRLILVLCLDSKIAIKFQSENIDDALNSRKNEFPEHVSKIKRKIEDYHGVVSDSDNYVDDSAPAAFAGSILKSSRKTTTAGN